MKIETQSSIRGTIQYAETYFGDYEEVKGLYYSFAFESGAKGDSNRVKFAVDKWRSMCRWRIRFYHAYRQT